ncbi:MAG TPA: ABC transporter substrate-binding protein [Candidatus Acidoferrales bacterium]|nr:ABC transporter substrate-binding protein [Candidatus Acidoferrales bacterium]
MPSQQRIVSLAPSVTSILLALGARHVLAGVSKWCKEVARVGKLPQVGDCWKLDIAEVIRLRPTLLIGSVPFAAETIARILEQPVAFLALNPRSIADIENDIRLLGLVANRRVPAEHLIRDMRRGFRAVAHRVATFQNQPKPSVYCEAWSNPRISSPPWVAEIAQIAGGRMRVPAGIRITDKEVARAKPDVIVLAWTATGDRAKAEVALRNPLWKDVPAVKSGRVVVVRDEWLNTPGPPLVQGAWALFRALHPEQSPRKKKLRC